MPSLDFIYDITEKLDEEELDEEGSELEDVDPAAPCPRCNVG